MNRKLFGNRLVSLVALALVAFFGIAACASKITGNPEKVVKDYIEAVKKGDFKVIYHLNRATERPSRYIWKSNVGDPAKMDAENMERQLATYNAAEPSFLPGMQWAEKFFFTPSCKVMVGKPKTLQSASRKEAMYESNDKGNTLAFPVTVSYPVASEAPEYEGKKIKYAEYTCMAGKIRLDNSLLVDVYDDKWYFSGCIIGVDTIQLQ